MHGLGCRSDHFRESFKICGVERIDTRYTVCEHRCRKLQVENITARYGAAAQQVKPPFHRAGRSGEDMQKRQQTRNRGNSISGGARLRNAPGDWSRWNRTRTGFAK